MQRRWDVVVIGAGPAGLAAALSAREHGAREVLVIDREPEPGGILLQCVHNGFGLETFREDLPGPSYAQRYIDLAEKAGVRFLMDSMVLSVSRDFRILISNSQQGILEFQAGAVVFAMGCRERSRAQIRIPGTRPAGVYTAGTAQRWVNMEGLMPGKRFVILGSGDIGMIMARRLTLEGAEVVRVVELMPYLSGLSRNLVQCLQDYDIPLFLSHTVTNVLGNNRVSGVEVCAVDAQLHPIRESAEIIPCDTLLLSVGLIPENELSLKTGVLLDPLTGGPMTDNTGATSLEGFFAAGNAVHVYDLVDYVSQAGQAAGKSATLFAAGKLPARADVFPVRYEGAIRYGVPQRISCSSLAEEPLVLQMRVRQPMEDGAEFFVSAGIGGEATGELLFKRKFPYARPGEMVTLTVQTSAFASLKECGGLTVRVKEETA